MSTETCMHCKKKFEINDGFENERSITCVDCLRKHFKQQDIIIKLLKKIEKEVK